MKIESVFGSQQSIPSQYTCDGENLSPPLRFLQVPITAKSLVLIVDDPDAPHGTFDHWVVWNLPPYLKELSAGGEEFKHLSPPPQFGMNGYKTIGYRGPCPPSGQHHYRFKLYALNTLLDLAEGSTKQEVEQAMQEHILEQDELVATYKRVS